MELIDKSAVVAEIEKALDEPAPLHDPQCPWEDGYYFGLCKANNIIDTLEVKEVDLEKEHKDMDEKIQQYLLWLVKPLWEDTINSVGLKKDDIIAWIEKK